MSTRRIGFLAFDGMQALDLFGPADAFGSDAFINDPDNEFAKEPPYQVVIIGLGRRDIRSSVGAVIRAESVANPASASRLKLDTLIVPGGAGLRHNDAAARATEWILAAAPHVRRIASVCTGIYGLAPTGLLDGRRVTTHWSAVADVAVRYPRLILERDDIFVKDGRFYTSAGVTAGIDLALALIEEDLGNEWALTVARELVVYLKRTGGQQQFSEPLRFQTEGGDRLGDLALWIARHLGDDLPVERLAARCCLSPRQFARAFRHKFGLPPGAFVEELRLAEASRRLAARHVPIGRIARSVGYASDDVFRRAFERRFGVSPTTYRRGFNTTASRARIAR
jgi:transcriptional regulator GlxA family with amidase domain